MGVVSIDGPSRSGKSTLAHALAAALGIDCLETGLLYRAMTCAVIDQSVDPADEHAMSQLAMHTAVIAAPGRRILLDGVDVTDRLRDPVVTDLVSVVAQNASIRHAVTTVVRCWADSRPQSVIEGRDIGSSVIPDAEFKVFLIASTHVRAVRDDPTGSGDGLEQRTLKLRERDERDAGREHDPLVLTDGMLLIDSSVLSPSEILAMVLQSMGKTK